MFIVARASQSVVGSVCVVRNLAAKVGQTATPQTYPEQMEAEMHADALNSAAVSDGGAPGTFKVYRLVECVTVADPVVPE